MSVPLLQEPPVAPEAECGPFRRRDCARLPEEPRCELIYGRFYVSPSTSPLHQVVVLLLAQRLEEIAAGREALVLVAPVDVTLADHSCVQPDVVYLASPHGALTAEGVEGAPELVVEVLSPGTARRDRGEKLRLYAETGVREYWIVDPQERQIEFLLNEQGRFVVAPPEGPEYRSRALPGIRLDLADFWRAVAEKLPAWPPAR